MGVCTFRREILTAQDSAAVENRFCIAKVMSLKSGEQFRRARSTKRWTPVPRYPLGCSKFSYKNSISYFQIRYQTKQHSCEGQRISVTQACPERRECEGGKSDFAILRASSLAKTPLRLVKPQNKFIKLPIGKDLYFIPTAHLKNARSYR